MKISRGGIAAPRYNRAMISVSLAVAKTQFSELARRVENGETVVVTRDGRPVFDLTPHRRRAGLTLEAIGDFKRRHNLETIFSFVAEDFDDPLPEDFLLRPLPPDASGCCSTPMF